MPTETNLVNAGHISAGQGDRQGAETATSGFHLSGI